MVGVETGDGVDVRNFGVAGSARELNRLRVAAVRVFDALGIDQKGYQCRNQLGEVLHYDLVRFFF